MVDSGESHYLGGQGEISLNKMLKANCGTGWHEGTSENPTQKDCLHRCLVVFRRKSEEEQVIREPASVGHIYGGDWLQYQERHMALAQPGYLLRGQGKKPNKQLHLCSWSRKQSWTPDPRTTLQAYCRWPESESISHSVVSHSLWPHGLYVAHQTPLSMQFSRQEYWSGLPLPALGTLPKSGIEHRSPAMQADSLPTKPSGQTYCRWPR